MPGGAKVTIEDALEALLEIGSGAPPSSTALIGQVDSAGDLHKHLDYSVTSGAAVGAYLITLQMVGLEDDLATAIYARRHRSCCCSIAVCRWMISRLR